MASAFPLSLKQTSFGGGIISPQLRGRTDQAKYAAGVRVQTNAWTTRYGTVENRPGTVFDVEVMDSSKYTRLVPFIFSQDLSYVLEFGEDYVRPLLNGAHIDLTGASPYAGGTTYAEGEVVTYLGVVYRALRETVGDTPDSSASDWNPQSGNILTIVTDVPQDALQTMQYVQQNDVMTLASHEFHPKRLLRYSNTRWVWDDFTLSAGISAPTGVGVAPGFPSSTLAAPTGLAASGGVASADDTSYVVTAYQNVPSQESVISTRFDLVGFVPDPGTPINVSWNAVAGADGYAIYRAAGVTSLPFPLIGLASGTSFDDILSTTVGVESFPIKSSPSGTAGNLSWI